VAKLADYGFSENYNLHVEPRYGHPAALPELARELVGTRPDVIVAVSRVAILAARQATSEIPIVMSFIGEDPVTAGLAANIARPGGNVTGLIMLAPELEAKRIELLAEAVPRQTP
jgi:putative ABC transport system substrate-binding protein